MNHSEKSWAKRILMILRDSNDWTNYSLVWLKRKHNAVSGFKKKKAHVCFNYILIINIKKYQISTECIDILIHPFIHLINIYWVPIMFIPDTSKSVIVENRELGSLCWQSCQSHKKGCYLPVRKQAKVK